MSDKTLKYEVWRGQGKLGKLATFRDLEAARRFLLSIRQTCPQAYIYDAVAEEYVKHSQGLGLSGGRGQ
jgi:hypothetical protein